MNGRHRKSAQKNGNVSRTRLRVLAVAVLTGLAAGFIMTTLESPTASARTRPPIMVSAKADRSAAKYLDGSMQSGLVHIFVTAASRVDKVTFVLDQGTAHARTVTDDTAPYDFAGTAPDGMAKPFDLSALAAGSHKVVVRFRDGSGRIVARSTANFTVVAARPSPTASSTPSPSPTSTPTSSSTATSTPKPTATSTPTSSSTATSTPKPTATSTPTSSATPSATNTTSANEVVVNAAPGGIAAALAKVNEINRQGKPVRLALQPTTYRESLVLQPSSSMTTAPIIIDGQGATISGADVLSSWTALGDGTYRHAWPHNLGNLADPWPTLSYDRVLLNREALFVRGVPYHVVDNAAKLGPGTFLVDEGGNTITVRPRAGDAPITAAEATVRGKTLQVNGRTNVTIRNLTLERGAGAVQESMAGASNSTNFTAENVIVRQAAAAGFSVGPGKGATLRNVRFLDNGTNAYGSYKQTDILIEGAELARNNWRGAQVGFTGWSAGTKFSLTRNVTIKGWNAHHNYSHGLWFDTDNRNVTVAGLVSAGNLERGVSLEKNPGPITIDGAKVCNNGMSGISYGRSDRTTVRNSEVFNNAGWQHLETGSATPVRMPDGTTVHGHGMTLQNTITAGDDWAQKDSISKGWLFWQTRDDAAYWDSAVFSGNTWYHTQRTNPFQVSSVWNNWYDYGAFATKAGETGGRWANPGTMSCPAPRPFPMADFAVGR